MTTTVEAIYEAGVLRLLEPINLEEGVHVDVIVIENAPKSISQKPDSRTPAEIMAEIAALPMEPSEETFAGRDHDKILYGEKGAR